MKLSALTRREASIFACLTDTVVMPEAALRPVSETDAVAFFDSWLMRMPRANRVALRALLYALELAPVAGGFGRRLRRLDADQRSAWLARFERIRPAELRFLVKAIKATAQLAYYGSDPVMLELGYDADANVARGRAVRAREGRA